MSHTIALTDMRPNTVVFDLDVDKVTAQDRNWDHDGIPNFVQVSETGRIPSRPRTPQAPVWILVARGVTIALTVLTLIALALSIKEEERLGYPSVPGSSSCLPPLIAVSIILTWSLIAFALAKPFNVRLHLAFYIVCDLIAWLALLSFGIFASIVAAFNEETKGWKCTSRFRPQVPNCEARSERLESVKLGAGCLTCILAIGHFAIFVWACREMNHINRHLYRKVLRVTLNLDALQVPGGATGKISTEEETV